MTARRLSLRLAAWVLGWHVGYFAWFVITGDVHAVLTGISGDL